MKDPRLLALPEMLTLAHMSDGRNYLQGIYIGSL